MDQKQPPRPFSFAAAASRGPPPGFSKPANRMQRPPGPGPAFDIRLKTWPKNKDPKVLNSYLQNLTRIPTHRELMLKINRDKEGRRLVIMRGVPGCGKSTFATILAGLCDGGGGIVLSADDFFMTQGKYVFNPTFLSDAHLMCKTRCESAMSASKALIVIDNTNTQLWEMLPYVELGLKHAYEIHVVEPETPWRTDPRVLAQKTVHDVPFIKIKDMLARYEKGITLDHLLAALDKPKEDEDSFSKMLDTLALK